MEERIFWETIYRSLLAIAAAIKKCKMIEAQETAQRKYADEQAITR